MSVTREFADSSARNRPAIVLGDILEAGNLETSTVDARNDWWVSYLDLIILALAVCAIFVWLKESSEDVNVVQSQSSEFSEIEVLSSGSLSELHSEGHKSRRLYNDWYDHFNRLIKKQQLSQQMGLSQVESGLLLTFTPGVLFSDDRVSLSRSGKALLAKLAPEIKELNAHIHIAGYNDHKERLAREFESKQVIAEERAIDVLDYFALKGIADKMMVVLPYKKDASSERIRISVLLTK